MHSKAGTKMVSESANLFLFPLLASKSLEREKKKEKELDARSLEVESEI